MENDTLLNSTNPSTFLEIMGIRLGFFTVQDSLNFFISFLITKPHSCNRKELALIDFIFI